MLPATLTRLAGNANAGELDHQSVSPLGEHLGAHLGFGHRVWRIDEEVGLGRRRDAC